MKNKLILTALVVLITIVSFSPKTFSADLIINDFYHAVSYENSGDTAIFTLEDLTDTQNDIGGKFPRADFAGIKVDRNKNGKMDKKIDTWYSPLSKNNICSVYFIDEQTSTTCGTFPSKTQIKAEFKKTKNNNNEHPVYTFTIPKSELATDIAGGIASLVFEFHSSERGYSCYPIKYRNTFTATYLINLNE
jgi:hypothetical protein